MLFGVDSLRGGLAKGNRISYVKHVLAPLHVFFTLFGCWGGGGPKGLEHNLLMQLSSPSSSKNGNHLAEVVISKPGRRI